jgi:hypothetical protein
LERWRWSEEEEEEEFEFFFLGRKNQRGDEEAKGSRGGVEFLPLFLVWILSLSPDHKFLPCAAAPDTIRAIAIAERRKREEAIVVGGEGGDCSKGELEGFLEVSERRVAPPLPLVEDIWL